MSNNTPQSEELFQARYEQTLQHLYTQTDVPASLTWADVQARRSHITQVAGKHYKLPRYVTDPVRGRLSPFSTKCIVVIIAAVLFVAVVTGATYVGGIGAVMSALGLSQATGIQPDQFTTLNQVKTVDGLTSKLVAAYADANNLIIGSSIDNPKIGSDGSCFADIWATSNGIAMPSMGMTFQDSGKNLKALTSLNTYQIQGNPPFLPVHAVFSYYCTDEGASTSYAGTHTTKLDGPIKITYDFTIPFHAGRSITVQQTVKDHAGRAITLERVVITPSETRLYIHGMSYFDMSLYYNKLKDDNRLTAGGKTYHSLHLDMLTEPSGPDSFFSVSTSADFNKHTTWILHILDPKQGPGWTFNFTI